MEACLYNELTSCRLQECVLKKELSEDGTDSFFIFLEILTKKEKKELYDQLLKNCNFFKEKVEEILNHEHEVKTLYDSVYNMY